MKRKVFYLLFLIVVIILFTWTVSVKTSLASEENSKSDCLGFVVFVKELFEDVTTATGYRYNATDNQGYGLDTIKIIQISERAYLGVHHYNMSHLYPESGIENVVRLTNSTDLLNWNFVKTLEQNASQPTIAKAPNGAYIIAFEKEENTSSHLKLHYYSNLSALIRGPPSFTIDIPRNLSEKHEGTPNFYNITVIQNTMKACIGFHYDNTTANADEVGIGLLTVQLNNPTNWTWHPKPQKEYNVKLREEWNVKGNIGDRDYGQIFGKNFTLQEGNLEPRSPTNYSTWRVFLYNHLINNFTLLNIKTHKRSTSFGNPTFTFLKSPNGNDCVVVTCFLFSEGAESGEAGELIFYKEFKTEPFNLTYKGNTYSVNVTSNSTISDFNFNETERSINFNVSGSDSSKGYCIVKLPNNLTQDLWHGKFTVLLDGKLLQFENWTDSENTYIYINYTHSEHKITIIPEFSTLAVLVDIILAPVIIIVRLRSRHEKRDFHNNSHI